MAKENMAATLSRSVCGDGEGCLEAGCRFMPTLSAFKQDFQGLPG